jgi:uncharacterized protein YukE
MRKEIQVPDLHLIHEPIQQAAQEMTQAAHAMQNKFDDMMNQIRSVADSFKGAAADVFQELSQRQGMLSQELGESFGTGGVTLNNMHEEINDSDNRGASMIGGGR